MMTPSHIKSDMLWIRENLQLYSKTARFVVGVNKGSDGTQVETSKLLYPLLYYMGTLLPGEVFMLSLSQI